MFIDIVDLMPTQIKNTINSRYYEEYKIGYTVGLMTSNEYENPYSNKIDPDSVKSYWTGFYEGRKKRGSKWI
jgi:hypothetical protein